MMKQHDDECNLQASFGGGGERINGDDRNSLDQGAESMTTL